MKIILVVGLVLMLASSVIGQGAGDYKPGPKIDYKPVPKTDFSLRDALLRAKETIKKKQPSIPDERLNKDVSSIVEEFPKIYPTPSKLSAKEKTQIVSSAWVDIRTKSLIGPEQDIFPAAKPIISGYGLLKVLSRPQGATVILNEEDTWEEKTNTERGVAGGKEHTVELKLVGYKPHKENKYVPVGGTATVDKVLERQ